ncbi:MAG: hypothetical protein QOE79_1534, partial [Sphingomonadales bacterium]|nr:hypothetical protein [Sphingomonadales bacterium]
MDLDRDGAEHFQAALSSGEVAALRRQLADHRASVRLKPGTGLAALIGPADALAATRLPGASAVFARYFDKGPHSSWSLGWHQDRTIAVRRRGDAAGFTAWTVKAGIAHAVPPVGYLERMLVLRIHLDEAGEAASPLLVAPGSHRFGAVPEPEIDSIVERCGTRACLAAAGDVWAYSALIL